MLNKKDLKNAFSGRLVTLMAEKDITQKELAREVDTSQQAIQQYIAMEAAPKMEMFVGIAEYFGVSCDYLLGRVETRTPDINIKEIAEKYGLKESSLKKLERLAAPGGKVGGAPPLVTIEGEEEPTVAELARRDALNLRAQKRAKDALKALNDILSWGSAGVLLSRVSEFLACETPTDDEQPIQLTQNGRALDYELAPDVIPEIAFSMVKDALYGLRDNIWTA
jgi:transcriptional regulator with XRE-family HTH domain